MVEAQHRVSTLKLVDSLDEQSLLEELVEQTKPLIPAECRHLHYLLATPFRYGAPYPKGSRFRRAGMTPGVFYASELVQTAVAEIAFHRFLFFAESPHTPWPADAAEFTAFSAEIQTRRAIDLTRTPFDSHRSKWIHPTHYGSCQSLADAARSAELEAIRYESARDPSAGANIAVLTCRTFAKPRPIERQTWRIRLGSSGVQAICEFPDERLNFDRRAFARDSRISAFKWNR